MRKKKQQSEASAPNLLMVMTVSLFIILLAFFILLNSIAVEDEARQRAALGSLMENFGVLSGGFSIVGGESQTVSSELIERVSRLLDVSDLVKGDDDPVQGIQVDTRSSRSVITIPASVLFDPGSTRIKPSSFAVLDRFCSAAVETGYSVEISGHTDATMASVAPGQTGRELSALQALSVFQYFVEAGDVDPDRVVAYGWGDADPLTGSSVREVRSRNQRIEIIMAHARYLEEPEGFFTFKNFFFNVLDK